MDISLLCAKTYLGFMLPTLHTLLEGTAEDDPLSLSARQNLVRVAADRSLVSISRGSCWSSALEETLQSSVSSENPDDCSQLIASNEVLGEGGAINMGDSETTIQRKLCSNAVKSAGNVLVRKRKSKAACERTCRKAVRYRPSHSEAPYLSSLFTRGRRSSREGGKFLRIPPSGEGCVHPRTPRSITNIGCIVRRFALQRKSSGFHLKAKDTLCKLGILRKTGFKRKVKFLKRNLVHCPTRQARLCTGDKLLLDKVQTLKKLVPGGATMETNHLLLEAADYILFLRFQIRIMQSLVAASSLETQASLTI